MTDGMKDSGIAWIGEMPKEWKISKMKYEIHEFGSGTTPDSGNDKYYEDGNHSWIQSGDLYGKDQITDTEKQITDYAVHSSKALSLYKHDFLVIAMYGASVGNCSISKIDAYTNQACCVLIPSRNDDINYFFYYLKVVKDELINKAFGGTQPNISQIIIKNHYCLKIPHSEQTAIASFLDKKCVLIDSIANDIERQIEILKRYKQSLITETVTKGLDKNVKMKDSEIEWIGEIPEGWSVKRMKYIGTVRNGLTYTPQDTADDGTLVLRSSNIQNGKLAFTDNVFVDMPIPSEIIVKENDLLICVRNGSKNLIGKCALINKETEGNTFGAFMGIFRSQYNKYIYYILSSSLFSYYLENFVTSTVNQLTNQVLYNIRIPFTSDIDEQKSIAAYLDCRCSKIDAVITDKQTQLDTLKKHKQSLIYEYVTGKKRVTEAA